MIARDRLPRRELGRGLRTLLVALAIYVALAVPVVIATFVRVLHG